MLMTRKTTLNVLISFAFGSSCAAIGFPYFTWQFWLLICLFAAAMANSSID